MLDARRHPLVTVEADQVRVESRLTAGQLDCPGCAGVLAPWGWARPRRVRGVGSLRPRRARCAGCLVTHVLLPVTVLLRRADAAEVIGAALTARAAGLGHRRIAVWLGVPAATVRGWLRRWGSRLEAARVHFTVVARLAGVDQAVPKALGSPWRDVLAALGAATTAVTARFGHGRGDRPGDGVAGRVPRRRVVGFSHPVGRPASMGAAGNTSSPLTHRPVGPGSSRGSLPGNTCRAGPSDDE